MYDMYKIWRNQYGTNEETEGMDRKYSGKPKIHGTLPQDEDIMYATNGNTTLCINDSSENGRWIP